MASTNEVGPIERVNLRALDSRDWISHRPQILACCKRACLIERTPARVPGGGLPGWRHPGVLVCAFGPGAAGGGGTGSGAACPVGDVTQHRQGQAGGWLLPFYAQAATSADHLHFIHVPFNAAKARPYHPHTIHKPPTYHTTRILYTNHLQTIPPAYYTQTTYRPYHPHSIHKPSTDHTIRILYTNHLQSSSPDGCVALVPTVHDVGEQQYSICACDINNDNPQEWHAGGHVNDNPQERHAGGHVNDSPQERHAGGHVNDNPQEWHAGGHVNANPQEWHAGGHMS
eukprot:1156447-Pelagomonas_calceolata.AAC.2